LDGDGTMHIGGREEKRIHKNSIALRHGKIGHMCIN